MISFNTAALKSALAGERLLEWQYVSDLPVLYDTDRWSKSVLGLAPRLNRTRRRGYCLGMGAHQAQQMES